MKTAAATRTSKEVGPSTDSRTPKRTEAQSSTNEATVDFRKYITRKESNNTNSKAGKAGVGIT